MSILGTPSLLCPVSEPPLTTRSYIEGIVRGYRNTLLTSQNYNNLTQCETIDGALTLHRPARRHETD
jgi:hypothetical protein